MASQIQWTWVWVDSGVGDGQEAWSAAVHGVAKSWTRLSDCTELNPLPKKGKEPDIMCCQVGEYTTTYEVF